MGFATKTRRHKDSQRIDHKSKGFGMLFQILMNRESTVKDMTSLNSALHNRALAAEVCDATGDAIRTAVGYIKNPRQKLF